MRITYLQQSPNFICDCMLGKLASYLRLIGADTLYFHHIEDKDLIEIALQDNRILLTRDHKLTQRKNIGAYLLIESDNPKQQLEQVLRKYPSIASLSKLSRCKECNSILQKVTKSSVKNKVPPYVYKTQELFKECQNCQRIYWRATHVEQMNHIFDLVKKYE